MSSYERYSINYVAFVLRFVGYDKTKYKWERQQWAINNLKPNCSLSLLFCVTGVELKRCQLSSPVYFTSFVLRLHCCLLLFKRLKLFVVVPVVTVSDCLLSVFLIKVLLNFGIWFKMFILVRLIPCIARILV